MLYEQYFIDDLKDRADLVRIIEPYAALKKKGSNWMGCCPFHSEKTPSFSVSPSKGFYKCFGCGKGGNAFTFLMEMEGLNFPEAIQRVAEMSGVPLPEPVDDQQFQKSKKKREEKKKLSDQVIELNAIALEFWESELQSKDKKATAARDYLKSRGISEEIQKQFRIGFSPDSWNSLFDHLKEKGADEKLIEQSGLVSVNEEKDRVFDRFRGRIMFPVLDVNGNPIAFGARAMGDDQPKYLNSPETPAYVKGQHLYGLFQSKDEIRKKKFAILVEGYLDLIALVQHDITNVVASLGTAFTPEQAKLLKRRTENVVVTYDSDEAGAKASKKILNNLLFAGFEIKVLQLPDNRDPDEFVREEGAQQFNILRGRATSILDFLIARMPLEYNLSNNQQRLKFADEVIPICASFRSTVKGKTSHREFFDQLMSAMRILDPKNRQEWWNLMKQEVASDPRKNEKVEITGRRKAPTLKITVAEQQLLELLVYDGELQVKVLPLLEETDYEALATAPVFRALLELNASGGEVSLEKLTELTGDDEVLHDFLPVLMMAQVHRETGEAIDDVLHQAENCLFTLRSMAISNRILEVSHELIAAEQAGDTSRIAELVAEHLDLSKMKQHLLNKIIET
ncbi:MAG: DNA primase [Acidobacteriota bacterium]